MDQNCNNIFGCTVLAQDKKTKVNLGQILLFLTPKRRRSKNKNLKIKKAPRDITVLNQCTKNHEDYVWLQSYGSDKWTGYFGPILTILPPGKS